MLSPLTPDLSPPAQKVLASTDVQGGSEYAALPQPDAAAPSSLSAAVDALDFGVLLQDLTQATFTATQRAKLVATLRRALPGTTFTVFGVEPEDEGVAAWVRATFPDLAIATPQALAAQLLHNLTGLVPPGVYGQPHLEGYSAPYLVRAWGCLGSGGWGGGRRDALAGAPCPPAAPHACRRSPAAPAADQRGRQPCACRRVWDAPRPVLVHCALGP